VAYSAFYMSRLEFVLRKLGIERVIMSGIVTNGGVLATAQDAHVRDFKVWMLSDGCAAFSRETHEATLRTLASIGRQSTCAQAAAEIAG
ncbi:MAG: cysteine hydrolase family protein, partial [Rhodospirillales bacterium]